MNGESVLLGRGAASFNISFRNNVMVSSLKVEMCTSMDKLDP